MWESDAPLAPLALFLTATAALVGLVSGASVLILDARVAMLPERGETRARTIVHRTMSWEGLRHYLKLPSFPASLSASLQLDEHSK